MNDEQLKRRLQTIGKECFVSYFRKFNDPTLSNDEVSTLLVEERKYMPKASLTRSSCARSIINAGRAKDAFAIIADSKKIEPAIREIASRMAAAQ